MSGAFVHPKSDVYANFIDYMNRNEAIRNEFFDTYNAFSDSSSVNYQESAGEIQFSTYNEYMSNPEKTDALIYRDSDQLSQEGTCYPSRACSLCM